MSFWETLLILLVAVLVIKPERLPEISYLLGRGFGKLQRLYQQMLEKYKLRW